MVKSRAPEVGKGVSQETGVRPLCRIAEAVAVAVIILLP